MKTEDFIIKTIVHSVKGIGEAGQNRKQKPKPEKETRRNNLGRKNMMDSNTGSGIRRRVFLTGNQAAVQVPESRNGKELPRVYSGLDCF